MATISFFILFPLGAFTYRIMDANRMQSNATIDANNSAGESLRTGTCTKCDTYNGFECALCPNCKRRGKRCMHKCTACCKHKDGCPVDYCICEGKENVFKDMWKDCGSQKSEKNYRFQVRVPQIKGQEEEEDYVAIEFQRTKDDPQLILHLHQEWAVELHREHGGCDYYSPAPSPSHMQLSEDITIQQNPAPISSGGNTHTQLSEQIATQESPAPTPSSFVDVGGIHCKWTTSYDWKPMAASSKNKPETKIVHLKDVQYIRVFKEAVAGKEDKITTLEIKFPDGENLKFVGGVYMTEWAFSLALDYFWPASHLPGPEILPPMDDGGIFVGEPEITYRPPRTVCFFGHCERARYDPDRLPTHKATLKFAKMFEYLMEHSNGGKKVKFQTFSQVHGGKAAAVTVGSWLGSMALAMTGAVVGSSLGPAGGIIGFFAGAALPVGTGVTAIWKYGKNDMRRELRLLASEKIFEKMRCHKLFQRCGGVAIAPHAKPGMCPYENLPDDSNLLYPPEINMQP